MSRLTPLVNGAFLKAIDAIRSIPDEFGLRPYDITVRIRTWSGSRPGLPGTTKSDNDFTLTVGNGNARPHCRQMTEKDIVRSGGFFSDQDFEVGPLTPSYAGSVNHTATTIFDPVVTGSSSPTEVFYNIAGPGLPSGGAWFKKKSQNVTWAMHYTLYLERTAEVT